MLWSDIGLSFSGLKAQDSLCVEVDQYKLIFVTGLQYMLFKDLWRSI